VISPNDAYWGGTRRPSFWKVSETSAIPVGGRDSLPLKITSSIERPRRCLALCSPIDHLIASTTFDLPQPFGPTTPVMPSSKEKTTRSANDLKPEISMRRIFICRGKIHESRIAYKACVARQKMGCVGGRQDRFPSPADATAPVRHPPYRSGAGAAGRRARCHDRRSAASAMPRRRCSRRPPAVRARPSACALPAAVRR